MSVRVGLLGCGRISKRHAEALLSLKNKDFELVGAVEIDSERARKFSSEWGVPVFTSLEELISHCGPIELVSVLSPSGLHAEHMKSVAQLGINVLVEKPFYLNPEDSARIRDLEVTHGIKIFVVMQNRMNPPIQEARKAFDSGLLGDPFLGTVRVRWTRDDKYYSLDSWRGTLALDGGVLANQASHHLDVLAWFMGEPRSVFAKTGRFGSRIEAEDTMVATITFASGAIGLVEATTATRPSDLEGSFSFLTTNSSIEIGGFALNEIRHWRVPSMTRDDAWQKSVSYSPPNVYGSGHAQYYREVKLALEGESSSAVGVEEAIAGVNLMAAIYESAEYGEEVIVGEPRRRISLGRES